MIKKIWKSLFGECFKLGGCRVRITKTHITITGCGGHIRFGKSNSFGKLIVGSATVTWDPSASRLTVNNEALEIV
jgi:hypothetical protein